MYLLSRWDIIFIVNGEELIAPMDLWTGRQPGLFILQGCQHRPFVALATFQLCSIEPHSNTCDQKIQGNNNIRRLGNEVKVKIYRHGVLLNCAAVHKSCFL